MIDLSESVITSANTIQFAPEATVTNNRVNSRMLLWCESGEGEVRVNGDRFHLTKDRFLLLPWEHSVYYKADRVNPYKLGGIHIIPYYSPGLTFRPEVAHNSSGIWWEPGQLTDKEIPGLSGIVGGYFNAHRAAGLKRLSDHIISLFHNERINRRTASAAATLLLDEIQLWVNQQGDGVSDERFERITDFIRENLSREISLEELCKVGAVSRSTLRRIFLKSTGKPPYQWIINTRLDRARYLLRTTSDSVSSISFQSGFEDSSYFSRLFHDREGKTPGQYRSEAYKI
jgi:AraC-like DNA-binding protein